MKRYFVMLQWVCFNLAGATANGRKRFGAGIPVRSGHLRRKHWGPPTFSVPGCLGYKIYNFSYIYQLPGTSSGTFFVGFLLTLKCESCQQTFQGHKLEALTYIGCMDTAYVGENPPPK